jgi:ABC-type antimicrobial peptide transport system permease subunit
MAVNIRKSMGRQSDLGIMKATGWTTYDIIRLQLYRALSVCLPSAAIGICLSVFMVYWPGTGWLGKIFLAWDTIPPKLYLEPKGAITVLLEVAGFILAPVIASALAPAIKGATADVHELIEGTNGR